MEAFDADVYTYLEYYRNNGSKENALKLYAADCDEYSNKNSKLQSFIYKNR